MHDSSQTTRYGTNYAANDTFSSRIHLIRKLDYWPLTITHHHHSQAMDRFVQKRTIEVPLSTSCIPPIIKQQKLEQFKDVIGSSISHAIAQDCLNATNYDLERAINMYFNRLPSIEPPVPTAAEPPVDGTQSAVTISECVCIGAISCLGSTTTKVSSSSNELYMGTPLNCTFTIKPPNNLFPDCPSELVDILYGSPLIRFSLPSNVSEIGRVPAPIAAALCPLVKLGFVDVSISVGFPGCAGLVLSPGASVPLRIDIAITAQSMKRMSSNSSDDLLIEKINNCWKLVLREMNVLVGDDDSSSSSTVAGMDNPDAAPEETILGESGSSEPSTDQSPEMTEEMEKFANIFTRQNLPFMYPSNKSFPTSLKPYQAQALYWMTSREYPKILNGGLPFEIIDHVKVVGQRLDSADQVEEIVSEGLPSGWLEIRTTAGGETVYYNDGFFSFEKPPPVVDCRGGILADEMGLGKTVMTLSLISLDLLLPRSSPAISGIAPSLTPGGTLIILHLSLLRQWVNELRRHCPSLRYLEFHGSDRTFNVTKLASVDVVFSTYGTVAISRDGSSSSSPLNEIAWRRVVLDEAHTIRTRSTKMSKAVSKLTAERRWCLTGTPLQNSIEDIYPLVAWLRVAPWRSYAYFRREISLKLATGEGLSAAQEMLKPIMIRRTKATKDEFGNHLVQLPSRRNEIIRTILAPEERDFYRALFWQTKLEFDKFEKSNQVMYNITHILQLLVRLRQALCHPILCRSALTKASTTTPGGVVDLDSATQSSPASLDDLLEIFMSKNTTSKEYLQNAIEDLKKIGTENIECPICLSEPCQFPIITPCGHTLCRKCCLSRLRQECPICRFVFPNSDIQNLATLMTPTDVEDTGIVCPPLSSKLRVLLDYIARDLRLGRRVIVFSQFVSFLEIISRVFICKKIPFKMLHGGHTPVQREAAVDWLINADIANENYSDTRWLDEISPCPAPLEEGEEEDAKIEPANQGRVFLVSLKAGGVGLNLVAANVVYLTDLWWNPSVEEQAFQRVHRLGQSRKVYTYKFVCNDTIDERILDLQATKSDMTNDVLGDTAGVRSGTAGANKKLTLEDIRQLFKPSSLQ